MFEIQMEMRICFYSWKIGALIFFFSLLFRLQSYKSFYTELHWMVPHRKTKIHHRQFLKCKNQTLMMLLEPMQFLIST